VTAAQLATALVASRAPVKAVLLNQHRIAGLGNLLVDEILWRAGIDPTRVARDLNADEVRRLHTETRRTLRQLTRRGGSHMGDLQIARERGRGCRAGGSALSRT